TEGDGLNEANSDIFGAMVEFYERGGGFDAQASTIPNGGGNLIHGDLVSGGTRDMILPTLTRPTAANEWFAGLNSLEEHDAAGPMDRAFAFLSKGASSDPLQFNYSNRLPWGMPGIGMDKASRIWYIALMSFMTGGADYKEARSACITAAGAWFGPGSPEVAAVKNAFAAINVGGAAAGTPPKPPTVFEVEPNSSGLGQFIPLPTTPSRLQIKGRLNTGPNYDDIFHMSFPLGKWVKISLLTPAQPAGEDYDLQVFDSTGTLIQSSTKA